MLSSTHLFSLKIYEFSTRITNVACRWAKNLRKNKFSPTSVKLVRMREKLFASQQIFKEVKCRWIFKKEGNFSLFTFCVSNCVLMLNISLIHLARKPAEEEKTENWRKIEVFNLEERGKFSSSIFCLSQSTTMWNVHDLMPKKVFLFALSKFYINLCSRRGRRNPSAKIFLCFFKIILKRPKNSHSAKIKTLTEIIIAKKIYLYL